MRGKRSVRLAARGAGGDPPEARQVVLVFDVVFENATIIDGAGTPAHVTDVAVAADRVARIGDCRERDAATRVDCRGLVICPGFIDMHGHSDEALLAQPGADSKIRQGITTEVMGNCGTSAAGDLDEFLSSLERARTAHNACTLVGLGTVRAAIGALAPSLLDPGELARASQAVRDACARGAIGVSSGLMYAPGSAADTSELIALASAAASAGAPFYATHLRSEGDALEEAVDEALEVGSRASVAVQLSHHKAAGKRNRGKVHNTLAAIDRARTRGVDAALDVYPYKAAWTGLDVMLPADLAAGDRPALARRLRDPVFEGLAAARLQLQYGDDWSDVVIASVGSGRSSAVGRTLAQIAQEQRIGPGLAAVRLLAEEKLDVSAFYFCIDESDLRAVLSFDAASIGTDAAVRTAALAAARGLAHPRAYGTFPRLLRRYVRELRLMALGDAIGRASAAPARRLGLRRRGEVREGWYADLCVFDPAAVSDRATYAQPHAYPDGVMHVLVNGEFAVRDGETTGLRAGKVLRRGRDLSRA